MDIIASFCAHISTRGSRPSYMPPVLGLCTSGIISVDPTQHIFSACHQADACGSSARATSASCIAATGSALESAPSITDAAAFQGPNLATTVQAHYFMPAQSDCNPAA